MLLSLLWAVVAIRIREGREGKKREEEKRGIHEGHEGTRREDMATEIVDEIKGVLKDIGQIEELVEPRRFAERVDSLETIEFQVLDRIENVMYMEGHQPALAPLYQRAAQLWRRLTAVNEELFAQLRDELAASAEPGVAARRQMETYVARRTVRDPVGYDDLDVFINGLFGMDAEPVETRPLKPGMIGYQATPIRFILDLVERIPLTPDDVFIDLGSGLGRVALLVGLLTPAQVRGIEYDPGHCDYARQCAQRLPACAARAVCQCRRPRR